MGQQNQPVREQAENYYYLGQIYSQLQQTDSAAYFYEKAIQTDPEYPFGYIGEGKTALMKGELKTAESLFKKATGLAKKNPSVQTTIAEVYIDANLKPQAEEALDKARKVNKKYPGIYVVEGDMLMKEGKTGEACARYENAIAFDKNDKIGYLKLARVYKNINTNEALRYLDELTAIDPEYIPAYAEIGDLYDMSSIDEANVNYTKALDAYEKFISIPGVPLLQHERYARLLYFTNQYEKSLQQIDLLLKENPNNQVMYRLKAYNNYKLGNNAVALAGIAEFLQNNPEDKHIYLDYITYGRILLKENQPENAIDVFLKAAALEPEKPEIYKELANTYELTNNYPEAVKQYEKYFTIEKTPVVFDYFYYGQANYSAASKYIDAEYLDATIDPEQKAMDDDIFKTYIEKGNEAFTEVINRSPESYIGYLWRARLNSFVDVKEQKAKGAAMQGAAKPYYEETLTVMLAANEDGKRNNEIIEAYRYLASYYLLLDDKINAGDYFKKILEVEPDNAVAKDALNQLKIKY
ncbi:MAG: tetratricopeptide repeat protein [Dysgonamonadaceae bacterium]|nr:tetratricopeptide repeat protein [Dysgonamonadaceae bacterium]